MSAPRIGLTNLDDLADDSLLEISLRLSDNEVRKNLALVSKRFLDFVQRNYDNSTHIQLLHAIKYLDQQTESFNTKIKFFERSQTITFFNVRNADAGTQVHAGFQYFKLAATLFFLPQIVYVMAKSSRNSYIAYAGLALISYFVIASLIEFIQRIQNENAARAQMRLDNENHAALKNSLTELPVFIKKDLRAKNINSAAPTPAIIQAVLKNSSKDMIDARKALYAFAKSLLTTKISRVDLDKFDSKNADILENLFTEWNASLGTEDRIAFKPHRK